MRKVLFLDIDGVCNSAEFMQSNRNPNIGGMLGLDPFAVVLVKMIIQDTGCDVVLSSTWRLNEWSRNIVRKDVVEFVDVTPAFSAFRYDDLPRGNEIQDWLDRHPEVTQYAILDDDSDMLESQMPNFFQTTWAHGITREIAAAVTKHLS
jgi:hypothetical protein